MSNRGSVGAASNNTSYAPARKAWLDALKRHSQTKLATPRNIDNSDLILYSCDGSAHHVHRHVLSVYSEYFADLFEDAEEGASFEYNAEFSNDVMKEILQWTYTGSLNLTINNAIPILVASEYFVIAALTQCIKEFLKQSLDVSNVSHLLRLSETCQCDTAKQLCLDYIASNYCQSPVRNESLKLTDRDFLYVINSNKLVVYNENQIYDAVIAYIDQLEQRSKAEEDADADADEEVDSIRSDMEDLSLAPHSDSDAGSSCDSTAEDAVHLQLPSTKASSSSSQLITFVCTKDAKINSSRPQQQKQHHHHQQQQQRSDDIIREREKLKVQLIESIRFSKLDAQRINDFLNNDLIPPTMLLSTVNSIKDTKKRTYIREFERRYDFDNNGIIYWLGSEGKKSDFRNPLEAGLISISASSIQCGDLAELVSREARTLFYTENKAKSWVAFDFGPDRSILLQCYTLRHNMLQNFMLRSWVVQGSNDGMQWSTLSSHFEDASINSGYGSHSWKVNNLSADGNNADERYHRYIRIVSTGHDAGNCNFLMLGGIEFYGKMKEYC